MTTITTCLDTNACPGDKMYNVICNFSIGINEYACKRETTCMHQDGKYDCCAKYIVGCIVYAESLRVPTIQPSVAISTTYCNQMCVNGNKIDKCYWYESMRTDNLCGENNNEYCCSQNRRDCCTTNQTGAYIVFGSIAGIMIIITIAYYWYYMKNSRNKIQPAKAATELEPRDRYNVINNL
jgi:hypothetical protein